VSTASHSLVTMICMVVMRHTKSARSSSCCVAYTFPQSVQRATGVAISLLVSTGMFIELYTKVSSVSTSFSDLGCVGEAVSVLL